MSEIVTTYLLSNSDQVVPMDRNEFYDEQIAQYKKNGKPTRAIEVVQVLLFSPDGSIVLQKRSATKRHNAGKIDKTVGGHVTFGDTPSYTVLAETLQEIQVPSFVVDNKEEFKKTLRLLKQYTDNSAFIYLVDSRICNFKKFFGEEAVDIANKYFFYLGVYGGSMKPSDREASGILYYDFDVLKNELSVASHFFTTDLQFFLSKYEKQIEEFRKTINQILTKA